MTTEVPVGSLSLSNPKTITITVYGEPAPQGSKRALRLKTGRVLMIEMSKKLKPWHEAVKYAALELCERLEGAVSLHITFTMHKPKSAPKTRITVPDKRPDIDKLCRSTLDALVNIGVIQDDSRVVRLFAEKVYPSEGRNALKFPGAVIKITKILP